MGRPLIEVCGVWKRLCRKPQKALRYALGDIARDFAGRPAGHVLRDGEFWALSDISLTVGAGEVVGVIGHNGAGKSTLINVVASVIRPTMGSVNIHTDRLAVIDPSGGLNPLETGRENAATQLAVHGIPANEVTEQIRAVEAFADIGDFMDAPVGTYSVGMRLRLAFSIYTRLKPDVLVIDEALGGGDYRFRNKFLAYLREYIDGGGAILLCSHEMLTIQALCARCMLLDRGRAVASGTPVEVIDRYHGLAREAAATRQGPSGAGTSAAASAATVPHQRCEIESVSMMAGGPDGVVPGAPLTIEVRVAVAEELSEVACAIEIGQDDVEAIATLVGGYPEEPYVMSPPCAVFRCTIGSLPLAPGEYQVRVGVSIPDRGLLVAERGYMTPHLPLTVRHKVDKMSNIVRGRKNIVHMECVWQMMGGEAVQTSAQ